MIEEEKPRRPARIVTLVVGFWVGGTILQSLLGWLLGQTGLLEPEIAGRLGQALSWGLLCVLSFVYRARIDDWLRGIVDEP